MSKARTEGFINDCSLGIKGFLFSPDFDTSQSMRISEMMKSMKKQNCIAEYHEIEFMKMNLPVVIIKEKDCYIDFKDFLKNYKKHFQHVLNTSRSYSLDINFLQKNMKSFMLSGINDELFLIPNNEVFICEVLSNDFLIFIGNPFVVIGKEDEFIQNPKYKSFCNMKLKRTKKASNSYKDNIEERQNILLKNLKNIFKTFVEDSSKNGFVIGTMSLFLNSGYAIIVGSKEDNVVCFKKDVFPYGTYNEYNIYRYTKSEIDNIILERKQYEEKRKKAEKRILFIESKLRDLGYSWTIISKNRISFEGNDYKTWMNAQDYDKAKAGWYSEDDFIDWINMEGSIPFKSEQINHFARILENISSDYKLLDIIPEKTCYGDCGGIAKFDVNGKEEILSLGDVKDIIYNISPIKKYTKDDFEKEFKKFNRKNIFKLLK